MSRTLDELIFLAISYVGENQLQIYDCAIDNVFKLYYINMPSETH